MNQDIDIRYGEEVLSAGVNKKIKDLLSGNMKISGMNLTPSAGLDCALGTGRCIVGGAAIEESQPITISIPANSSGSTKTHYLYASYIHGSGNECEYELVETPSASENFLLLATISVPDGAATILAEHIVSEASLSGLVNLNSRVSTSESDIESLEGRMTSAEGTISTHEGEITQAQSDIIGAQSTADGAVTDAAAAQSTADGAASVAGQAKTTADNSVQFSNKVGKVAESLNELPIGTASFKAGNVAVEGTTYVSLDGYFKATRVYAPYLMDYAEFFERGEKTQPGDIIALDEFAEGEVYVKARVESQVIVGVHSSAPAQLVGGDGEDDVEDRFIPVALCGRVPIRVYGSIRKGERVVLHDQLPGVGVSSRKELRVKRVVGIAVESKKNEAIGLVNCFVFNAMA